MFDAVAGYNRADGRPFFTRFDADGLSVLQDHLDWCVPSAAWTFLFLRQRRIYQNNLKLYKAETLKGIEFEERHFAANEETGPEAATCRMADKGGFRSRGSIALSISESRHSRSQRSAPVLSPSLSG